MSDIAVIAKLVAKEGQRDQLADALQGVINGTAGEEGTLLYLLHADSKDADVLWFYERYSDDAALKTHQASDTMKAAGPALAPFMAAAPELHFCSLLGGKGA